MGKEKIKNKSRKGKAFVLIIAILIIIPIITAQVNYGKNIVSAQSFSTYTIDGYIQDQGATSVFKYGFNSSSKSGCGWIATYNVLTFMYNKGFYDKEVPVEDVIKPLDSFASFGFGYLGTNPLAIKWFLEIKGFKVEFIIDQTKFKEKAKASDINIIAYLRKNLTRGHYQMMEYDEAQDDFIFYTSSSRKTIESYLADHENDYTFLLTVSI